MGTDDDGTAGVGCVVLTEVETVAGSVTTSSDSTAAFVDAAEVVIAVFTEDTVPEAAVSEVSTTSVADSVAGEKADSTTEAVAETGVSLEAKICDEMTGADEVASRVVVGTTSLVEDAGTTTEDSGITEDVEIAEDVEIMEVSGRADDSVEVMDGVGTTVEDSVGATTDDSVGVTTEDSIGVTTEDSVGATDEDSVEVTAEDSVGITIEDSVGVTAEDSVGVTVEDSIG